MRRTIIVPLSDPQQDEDGIAERAIAWARVLTESDDAHIMLVSAIEDEASRVARQAYLDHIAGTLDGRVLTRIACGKPDDVILDTVAHMDSPTIVMASHGRRGVLLRVMGSTAAAIARRATCPVLILPVNADVASPPARRIGRVLLPMNDASIASVVADAAVAALGLERAQAITFHLVEVTPPIPPQPATCSDDHFQGTDEVPAHFLRRIAQQLSEQGIHATWSLRIGHPARELSRLAHERDIGLLAIPAYSRHGVNGLVPEVIAELAHSPWPVPVLLIPEIALAQTVWKTLRDAVYQA